MNRISLLMSQEVLLS